MAEFQVVSRSAHADKRWRVPVGYAAFADQAVALLVGAELSRAAMHLPLAFVESNGAFLPVAVLGLAPQQNLLVAADGKWQGDYIPALFRAYPFRMADLEGGESALCVDAAMVTDAPDGQPFFNADGTPAEGVARMLNMLDQMQRNHALTQAACAVLQAQGVLVPWEIKVERESATENLAGLFKVDESRLNALDEAQFAALRQHGALTLAYCQLLSMQHLSKLGQLAQQRQARPAVPTALNNGGELDLSFLSRTDTFSFGNTYL